MEKKKSAVVVARNVRRLVHVKKVKLAVVHLPVPVAPVQRIVVKHKKDNVVVAVKKKNNLN